MPHAVALLVTGASGMALPRHLLRVLAGHAEVARVHLVVSRGASQVLAHELGRDRTGAEALVEAAGVDGAARDRIAIHRDNELDAPIASGSVRLAATIVLPASSGTVGAFATGIGQSHAGIGPMAIVEMPDGSFLVSGGPGRNQLFHMNQEGGVASTPLATLSEPIFALAIDSQNRLWAATGGGPIPT